VILAEQAQHPLSENQSGLVCLTATGVILVVENLSRLRVWSRILLGLDSLVFLVAALLSLGTMRAHVRGTWSRLYPIADAAMLIGMIGAALICCLLLFTLL
jgi:hypothetical protein